MPAPTQILIDGLILTAVFSAIVIPSVVLKPRLWLHDFPADIQAKAPPKTAAERRQTLLLAVLFFAALLGTQFMLTARLHEALGAAFTPLTAFVHAYGMFFVVNLIDLVVIDWAGFALFVDPQRPPLPGTEGAAGYRDYAFHFYGFLKGCLIGIGYALVVALVYALISGVGF